MIFEHRLLEKNWRTAGTQNFVFAKLLKYWRSLGDSNPCFRRERATRIAYEPCLDPIELGQRGPARNLVSHRSGAAWVPWNVAAASLLAAAVVSTLAKDACSPPRRMSHSLLWLAAIQIVERKYNLPGLTPKRGFIATEAVEGIIGQIAEPQETTCKLYISSNLASA